MSRKAFTLIELLVASALFLLLVSTSTYLLKLAGHSLNVTKELSQAFYSAKIKMEEVRATSFEALSSFSFADGKGKVAVTPMLTDLKNVTVELNWDPKKLPVKFWTLRSKY